MKYTVILPPQPSANGEVFLLVEWRREIGEMVAAGDTIALIRAGVGENTAPLTVASPAFGILSRKIVLPGEAIEVGEPLAVLSGASASLVSGSERIPAPFSTPPPYAPDGPEQIVTLSPTQQAVAEHMTRSAQASPHVYTFAVVEVDEVQRLAALISSDLLPFIAAAVASALTRHPSLNAERVDSTQIRRKQYIHLGLALRTPNGDLAVPVLRDADRKSVRTLAREINNFQMQAGNGSLPLESQRGATFTLSAEGSGKGTRCQTPLIYQPQASLLRMGGVEKTPIVNTAGEIAVCSLLHLCLAHDARMVADHDAAAFLRDVKTGLEEARFLFSA